MCRALFAFDGPRTKIVPNRSQFTGKDPLGATKPTPQEMKRGKLNKKNLEDAAALGGLVVRDTRVWHPGMPNETKKARTMISAWWGRALRGSGLPMSIRESVLVQLPKKVHHLLRLAQVHHWTLTT